MNREAEEGAWVLGPGELLWQEVWPYFAPQSQGAGLEEEP